MSARATAPRTIAPHTIAVAATAITAILLVAPGPASGSYLDALAAMESGGNPLAYNQYGFAGLYQHGGPVLVDAGWIEPGSISGNDWSSAVWTPTAQAHGVSSIQDYLGNAPAQNAAQADVMTVQWGYIQHLGLDAYVGQTIDGIEITESGLLAGAHLVGAGGLRTWLQSNGATAVVDGNGHPVSAYVEHFGGMGSPFDDSPMPTPDTGQPLSGAMPSPLQALSTDLCRVLF